MCIDVFTIVVSLDMTLSTASIAGDELGRVFLSQAASIAINCCTSPVVLLIFVDLLVFAVREIDELSDKE